MINFIKKRLLPVLLLAISLLIVLELVLSVLWGYMAGDFIIFILMKFIPALCNTLIIISILVIVWTIIKRQHKLLLILGWIFLTTLSYVVDQIPIGHFETIGGVLSVYNSSPKKILDDARMLANEYPSMTCIGSHPQRDPCASALPRDNIPPSIRKIYVGNILILKDYVLIEKFGLQGVFRGFVAFREGYDPWIKEASITRKNCSDCWKIRIIDNLYWYSANPSSRPTYIDPVK